MAGDSQTPQSGSTDERMQKLGLVESHGIELDAPAIEQAQRPPLVSHLSDPAYYSPIRHHRRETSRTHAVKETLNAKSHWGSEDDGAPSIHKLNQYSLGAEIGRGSFGCVRLAKDQYGNEFAVKEFSKSRLRKRAQSNLLRRPGPHSRTGTGLMSHGSRFNSPMGSSRSLSRSGSEGNNAFELIKSEIAVMKKLDHPNLVSLIEVLDDPDEDSLYMVLELCKKGVVMKIDLGLAVDPYSEETCRTWFRDLILGLEYLHAQGIVHRDVKPDNCLITEDDVLKIVDFGVSEMFDKQSDMSTSKSTGSPAFMPPELCVANHGNVSGRAVDIWSMGVTLYCLRFGRIPFERENIMDLFDSIKDDELNLRDEPNEHLCDLFRRILEKDPEKRIKMPEIREHPWVTRDGEDPLLSEEENCSHIVDQPTEHEINTAITSNMGRVLAVARAVKRFKGLLQRKRPEIKDGILGNRSRFVAPPATIEHHDHEYFRARSQDTFNRRPVEGVLAAEGVHHDLHIDHSGAIKPHAANKTEPEQSTEKTSQDSSQSQQHSSPGGTPMTRTTTTHSIDHPERHINDEDHKGRGHAHDPMLDSLFLKIGVGAPSSENDKPEDNVVSESPGGTEDGIFEKAYQEEMDRIQARQGKAPTLYLTRRVDHIPELKERDGVVDHTVAATTSGLAGILAKAGRRLKAEEEEKKRKHGGDAEGEKGEADKKQDDDHHDGE